MTADADAVMGKMNLLRADRHRQPRAALQADIRDALAIPVAATGAISNVSRFASMAAHAVPSVRTNYKFLVALSGCGTRFIYCRGRQVTPFAAGMT